jgi:hypothetical protein
MRTANRRRFPGQKILEFLPLKIPELVRMQADFHQHVAVSGLIRLRILDVTKLMVWILPTWTPRILTTDPGSRPCADSSR